MSYIYRLCSSLHFSSSKSNQTLFAKSNLAHGQKCIDWRLGTGSGQVLMKRGPRRRRLAAVVGWAGRAGWAGWLALQQLLLPHWHATPCRMPSP